MILSGTVATICILMVPKFLFLALTSLPHSRRAYPTAYFASLIECLVGISQLSFSSSSLSCFTSLLYFSRWVIPLSSCSCYTEIILDYLFSLMPFPDFWTILLALPSNVSRVWSLLIFSAVTTLVCVITVSHCECCCSLLNGLPACITEPLWSMRSDN